MFSIPKPSLIVAAVIACLLGVLSGCSDKPDNPDRPDKPDNGFAITIERSGGMMASKDPFTAYRFTMTKDGGWEFRSHMTGGPRKGKVGAGEVEKWLKEIEEGGFDKLKSSPKLGQLDQPFMDITLGTAGGSERKRLALAEQLSQAIHKKIVEFVGPGK